MGILGTDYTLRTGQVIFLLLAASSLLLGFSYLNEMYQRIQFQDKLEKQAQYMASERTFMQRRASLLQSQIESRNKEMKRLQDIHEFQTKQRNSICQKETDDLLQTISSKDGTITKVQNQYESLKHRFEHLQSVMEQFEKNQSSLLEKFSTQSTRCMNVIKKLSDLCDKGNIIRKIAQVTAQNETFVERPITRSSALVKATPSTLLVSPPQDFYKTSEKRSTEFSRPPTKDTTPDSDHGKQSSLRAMQTLLAMVSELNRSNSTKDNLTILEKIQNSTEHIFKSQTEEGKNYHEKDLPKNMTLQETVVSQKENSERQTRGNGKRPALNETSEFEKRNQSKIKKVTYPQYPMLISKNLSIQLKNQDSRRADRYNSPKVEHTGKPIRNITMAKDNLKTEAKTHDIKKYLELQKKPQRLSLEKVKPQGWDSYAAEEESEYEENIEDVDKDLKSNGKEVYETIF